MNKLENYIIYDAKQKTMLEKVKKNMNNWLCLYGNSGTGKDHIANYILATKKKEGKKVLKVKAFRIMLKIKSNYINAIDLLDELVGNDVLVINEIEKFWKGTNDSEREILFEIIDDMYRLGGQLIIISNISWAELQEKGIITPAIADRFAEKGTKIEFNWESYRTKKIKR